MNTNSNVYSLRSYANDNLFVPRPNSNFMKRTFHYSGTILWNSLPPNLKLIQDIDLFKKKYTYYSMSKQNNEWLYSLYQGFNLDYTPSDCDISLWICMYCLKLYLLYLIIIALRVTGKISLLLLTVLPSWNKVITYLLTYLLTIVFSRKQAYPVRMISQFTTFSKLTNEKCVRHFSKKYKHWMY
jgi:hypothetical protein